MWHEVQDYQLGWDPITNKGWVVVSCPKGEGFRFPVGCASELSALGDILRNEKAIFYSPKLRRLVTGEMPSEGDDGDTSGQELREDAEAPTPDG